MAYVPNLNYGSIFKTKLKEFEYSPDYTGEINVDGKIYFIDGFIKEAVNGKYLSLRVKLKNKQPESFDNGIPF